MLARSVPIGRTWWRWCTTRGLAAVVVVGLGAIAAAAHGEAVPRPAQGCRCVDGMFSAPWRARVAAAAETAGVSTPDSARTPSLPPPRPPEPMPAPSDTAPSPRIVRRFEPIEVHAQLHDLLSSETVHLIPTLSLRMLPADRLADVLALKAGVVARGEDLHVRGGRSGELRVLLEGVELNDPQRGAPMELPLTALRAADLMTGGLEAEHGGALAGVLELRTVDPGPRWDGELQWQTDGALSTRYDRVAGRVGGPVGAGLGAVVSGDALLDGTPLPSLRTNGRSDRLGRPFGWRDDNRLLGHVKIAPIGGGAPWSLQAAASRRLRQPYDPMWSWDGYITFCPDPPECIQSFTPSQEPLPNSVPYHAANHHTMTDEHRLVGILTAARGGPGWRATSSLGWAQLRSITSLNGRDDKSYAVDLNAPQWGNPTSFPSDPFLVYWGDEPYFRKAESEAWTLRASLQRQAAKVTAKAGLGLGYERSALFELDDPYPAANNLDSVRTYDASAPGGFAFGQARWQSEGMVVTGGLRVQYFTAGEQARGPDGAVPPAVWSYSPRFGLTYPLSDRDAFSASYVRIDQPPARDLLYEDRDPFKNIVNRRPTGNGAIRPATTISYQAAIKHLFGARWATQAAVFYRDLFGLVGVQDANRHLVLVRLQYADKDEGHAGGFELSAFHADGERLRAELHYTFMNAWGTESDPEGTPFGPLVRDRLIPIGEHPLDWDITHVVTLSLLWQRPGAVSLSWSTVLQSGAPWTPHERRTVETDEILMNDRRLSWSENSSLAARWQFRVVPALWFGVDVRNVFDWRGDLLATLDGHPHPRINTIYDDYGAFRTETGLGGGAYFEDVTGDGVPEWVRVHDPRLRNAPRSLRLMAGVRW